MKLAKNMTSLFASLVATSKSATAFSAAKRSVLSSSSSSTTTASNSNLRLVPSPSFLGAGSAAAAASLSLSSSQLFSSTTTTDDDAQKKLPYESDPNYDYDMVVIGGGSGGVRASRIASGYGANVLLLEGKYQHGIDPYYSAIGGTCVNVGCVPKKLMVFASRYPAVIAESQGYGWQNPTDKATFSWDDFMEAKNTEITRLNNVYSKFVLANAGVETREGLGTFFIKTLLLQLYDCTHCACCCCE